MCTQGAESKNTLFTGTHTSQESDPFGPEQSRKGERWALSLSADDSRCHGDPEQHLGVITDRTGELTGDLNVVVSTAHCGPALEPGPSSGTCSGARTQGSRADLGSAVEPEPRSCAGADGVESSELCSISRAGGAARTQVSADRLGEQLGGRGQSQSGPTWYRQWQTLRSCGGNSLEEPMMAWKKRSVICRRFFWFSSRFSPCSSLRTQTGAVRELWSGGLWQVSCHLTWWDPPQS